MSKHHQKERIVRVALERDFNAVDFDPPNVIDGGTPIQRVAARVYDLKVEDDIHFEDAGRRQKSKVYRLSDSSRARARAFLGLPVAPSPTPAGGPENPSLFDQEAA